MGAAASLGSFDDPVAQHLRAVYESKHGEMGEAALFLYMRELVAQGAGALPKGGAGVVPRAQPRKAGKADESAVDDADYLPARVPIAEAARALALPCPGEFPGGRASAEPGASDAQMAEDQAAVRRQITVQLVGAKGAQRCKSLHAVVWWGAGGNATKTAIVAGAARPGSTEGDGGMEWIWQDGGEAPIVVPLPPLASDIRKCWLSIELIDSTSGRFLGQAVLRHKLVQLLEVRQRAVQPDDNRQQQQPEEEREEHEEQEQEVGGEVAGYRKDGENRDGVEDICDAKAEVEAKVQNPLAPPDITHPADQKEQQHQEGRDLETKEHGARTMREAKEGTQEGGVSDVRTDRAGNENGRAECDSEQQFPTDAAAAVAAESKSPAAATAPLARALKRARTPPSTLNPTVMCALIPRPGGSKEEIDAVSGGLALKLEMKELPAKQARFPLHIQVVSANLTASAGFAGDCKPMAEVFIGDRLVGRTNVLLDSSYTPRWEELLSSFEISVPEVSQRSPVLRIVLRNVHKSTDVLTVSDGSDVIGVVTVRGHHLWHTWSSARGCAFEIEKPAFTDATRFMWLKDSFVSGRLTLSFDAPWDMRHDFADARALERMWVPEVIDEMIFGAVDSVETKRWVCAGIVLEMLLAVDEEIELIEQELRLRCVVHSFAAALQQLCKPAEVAARAARAAMHAALAADQAAAAAADLLLGNEAARACVAWAGAAHNEAIPRVMHTMGANSEQVDRIGAIHGVMPHSQQLPPQEDDEAFATFLSKPAMLSTTIALAPVGNGGAPAAASSTGCSVDANLDAQTDGLVASALALLASNSLSGQEEGARMVTSLCRAGVPLRRALVCGGVVTALTNVLLRDSTTMPCKENALGALALLTEPRGEAEGEQPAGDLPHTTVMLPMMRGNGVFGGLATNVDAFVSFDLRDQRLLVDPADMLDGDPCDTLCALLWILRAKGRIGEFKFSQLCRERAALALANLSCDDRARCEAVSDGAATMCAELLISASGDRRRSARSEALGALSVLLRERDARIELAGGFVDETLDPEIASDRPAHFGLIALLDALRDNYEIAQERAASACCHIALDRECCVHIASLPAASAPAAAADTSEPTGMVPCCIQSLVQLLRAPSSSNLGRRLSLAALAGIAQTTSICWATIKELDAISCVRELLQAGTMAEQEEAVRCVKQIADSTAADPKLCVHIEELLALIESGENNDDIFFGDGIERPALELDAAFNMIVPGQSRKRKALNYHVVNTPW